MQPEPQDRIVPLVPGPQDVPEDRELALLDATLAAAGSEARRNDAAPTAAFAEALRRRLLADLPVVATTPSSLGADVVVTPPHAPVVPAVRRAVRAGAEPAADPVAARLVAARPVAADPVAARLVAASTTWTIPSLVPSWRASALALAAVLVVALLGVGTMRLLPVVPDASVVAASGSTLVRDGTTAALAPGAALETGDEVRVAADGSATLSFGRGETRLAPGAELRVVALERGRVSLEQIAGRAWHRVAVPEGTTYRVTTGPVEWVALGTAFDLGRRDGAAGGEVVRVLGIEHAVRVVGPDLSAVVDAGREATVVLDPGVASPDLAIGALDPALLDDPWLLANARRDAVLGFDPGVLVALEPSPDPSTAPSRTPAAAASPSAATSPSPAPVVAPSIVPSTNPSPTPKSTEAPTPAPTAKATPTPTPTPKPTATPAPAVGTLSLALGACHGGIVLDWSAWKGEAFDHYTVFRSNATFAVPKRHPPTAPVVALDGTYTTDRATTSSHDAGLSAGATYHYRALAFDAEDRVIASSPPRSAVARGIKPLGTLEATADAGAVSVAWTPYGGPGSCFSYYKVVWSSSTKTPSYLGDHDGAIPTGEQADSALTVDGMGAGTYWFRVQAIRVTELGKFVAAQTSVAKVVVP